jgi:hypothetical protein
MFRTYIEITETNITVSKQTKTTLNFSEKNTKICPIELFRFQARLFRIETSFEGHSTWSKENKGKYWTVVSPSGTLGPRSYAALPTTPVLAASAGSVRSPYPKVMQS